jgi:hypothetical protein
MGSFAREPVFFMGSLTTAKCRACHNNFLREAFSLAADVSSYTSVHGSSLNLKIKLFFIDKFSEAFMS